MAKPTNALQALHWNCYHTQNVIALFQKCFSDWLLVDRFPSCFAPLQQAGRLVLELVFIFILPIESSPIVIHCVKGKEFEFPSHPPPCLLFRRLIAHFVSNLQ